MNESELFALAEELVSFEREDKTIDLDGLEKFADRTKHLTDQQHADILNLAQDIREQRKGETNNEDQTSSDSEEVIHGGPTVEASEVGTNV